MCFVINILKKDDFLKGGEYFYIGSSLLYSMVFGKFEDKSKPNKVKKL